MGSGAKPPEAGDIGYVEYLPEQNTEKNNVQLRRGDMHPCPSLTTPLSALVQQGRNNQRVLILML